MAEVNRAFSAGAFSFHKSWDVAPGYDEIAPLAQHGHSEQSEEPHNRSGSHAG